MVKFFIIMRTLKGMRFLQIWQSVSGPEALEIGMITLAMVK